VSALWCRRCGNKALVVVHESGSHGAAGFGWVCRMCGRRHVRCRNFLEVLGDLLKDLPDDEVDAASVVISTEQVRRRSQSHHWPMASRWDIPF
jgi:hypothetical protein